MSNVKATIAELVGTFGFVFIGVGSVASDALPLGKVGPLGISLAHGLALGVFVTVAAATSGGHLNPAVTIGAWLTNRIPMGKAIGYIVAQVLGALAAVAALSAAVPGEGVADVVYGIPSPGGFATDTNVLAAEAILSGFLMLAVLGSAMDSRAPKVGGLFIGLTVVMCGIVGGPISGACLNPARYLGPAIIGGKLENWVLYVGGPILGMAVAALLYHYAMNGKEGAVTAS